MAYGTPAYNYSQASNRLAQNKTVQDSAADYGRFLGQENFRRSQDDKQRQFTRGFPQVGQAFQNRGMYNSGLRQQGQTRYAGDYQRDVQRGLYDQAASEQQFQKDRTISDAGYNQQLLQLWEQFQAARAAGDDPFDAIQF